jgi:hypothetical protein
MDCSWFCGNLLAEYTVTYRAISEPITLLQQPAQPIDVRQVDQVVALAHLPGQGLGEASYDLRNLTVNARAKRINTVLFLQVRPIGSTK